MSTLAADTRTLLNRCAAAIIDKNPRAQIDLSGIQLTRGVAEYLGNRVGLWSGGVLTIRPADPALFAYRHVGPCCYLVVCPVPQPNGLVLELTESMALISLRPYEFGLAYDAEAASSESAAVYRSRRAGSPAPIMHEASVVQDTLDWLRSLSRSVGLEPQDVTLDGSGFLLLAVGAVVRDNLGISLQEYLANHPV